jgi:hypothetical protein
LRPAERNYHPYELELFAVVHALGYWRHYLQGRRVTVVTAHQSVRHINSQPTLTSKRQARWMEKLQEFDLDIQYKPGRQNVVADALSRRPHAASISTPGLPLMDDIKQAQAQDAFVQDLLKRHRKGEQVRGYLWENEVLFADGNG